MADENDNEESQAVKDAVAEAEASGTPLNFDAIIDKHLPMDLDEDDRDDFFEEEPGETIEIGTMKLRVFSWRSFRRAVQKLKLNIILGSIDDVALMSTEQILEEVMIVAWMQGSDPKAVRAAFKAGQDAIDDAVEEFEDGITFDDREMVYLMREVLKVVLKAKKSWFRLTKRQGAPAGDTPPKNS